MNETKIEKDIDLSIIIPVFNEESVLDELFSRLKAVLFRITPKFEVIFVEDESTDNTLKIISDFNKTDPRFKYIKLSRRFSQQIAISAGIDFAEGKAVVVMDADLQDPPELIPDLVAKWRGGAEVVYAKRESRGDTLWKRLSAQSFYFILSKLGSIKLPVNVGEFRLMDRKVILVLRQCREASRYMRGLSVWVGFKHDFIIFNRPDRQKGKTHFSYSRMFRVAIDGITAFSAVPLRLATYFGIVCALLGFVGILMVLLITLLPGYGFNGWATIVVSILFMGGIQLIILGIIGEYIGRIYTEVQRRPLYIIKDKVGL